MPHYNRYRARPQISSVMGAWSYQLSQTGCTTGVQSQVDIAGAYTQGKTEYMLDVESGGWKARKGKQFIFNDMYKLVSECVYNGEVDFTLEKLAPRCSSPTLYETNHQWGEILAVWFGPCLHQTIDATHPAAISSLTDEVWTKCLANRMKGNADLLETLAELDKTFAMLQKPFENVITLVKSTRRNGKRMNGYEHVAADSKDYIQFVSSEWLRFRFGVMPIIRDVISVMEALEKGRTNAPTVSRAQASGSLSGTKSTPLGITGSVIQATATQSTAHSVKVRAYWYDRFVRTIWNDLGFNIRSLTGLAWELLRYSMVVDWFANVGDVIYANAPRVSHESLGGQVRVEQDINTFLVPTSFSVVNPALWRISAGGATGSIRRTDRIVSRESRPPISSLVFKTDFGFGEWTRVADATALVMAWLGSIGFHRH